MIDLFRPLVREKAAKILIKSLLYNLEVEFKGETAAVVFDY